MSARRRPGRKILIASIGVATLNYVAVSCGGTSSTGSGMDAATRDTSSIDDVPVANLVAVPHDAIDDFPVANLVAVPPDVIDDFPVANLVAIPPDAGEG
jgi:hypothetical protein